MKNEKSEPVRPVHEVRLGKIRASVWGNRTNNTTWYSITLARLYKDKEGKFQQAESFGPEDLPTLDAISSQLQSWYFSQANRQEHEEADHQGTVS